MLVPLTLLPFGPRPWRLLQVTLYEQDAEGGVWTAVNGWTGNLLRVYTLGQDGFEDGNVEAQGLACASGTCTLTFGDITTDRCACWGRGGGVWWW